MKKNAKRCNWRSYDEAAEEFNQFQDVLVLSMIASTDGADGWEVSRVMYPEMCSEYDPAEAVDGIHSVAFCELEASYAVSSQGHLVIHEEVVDDQGVPCDGFTVFVLDSKHAAKALAEHDARVRQV